MNFKQYINEAKKVEATAFSQMNGYMFKYGIKINMRKSQYSMVTVRSDGHTDMDKLQQQYIDKINKMKIADALAFIEEEIEMGYLGSDDGVMISDWTGDIEKGEKVEV